VPERVDQKIRVLLENDPGIDVRYTSAVTPDSYWARGRTLFVHPSHRDAAPPA